MSGSSLKHTRRRVVAAAVGALVVLAVTVVGIGTGDVLDSIGRYWHLVFVTAGLLAAGWGLAVLVWVPLSTDSE